MTNEELVERIQAGEKDKIGELWEQVHRFVAKQARNTLTEMGCTGGVTFDDFYNSGFLALLQAVRTFKSDGKSFLGWLAYYLKTAFAEASGFRTVRDRNDPLRCYASLSFYLGDDKNSGMMSDVTADPEGEAMLEAVEERIFAEQLRDAVQAVLDDIPTEQSAVIRKRYLENLTQEQTGQELGVDKNEVVRKEEAALRLLRRGRYASKLRPFYDYNYYSGTGLGSFLRTGISVQEKYVLAREKLEQKAARAAEREDPN